MPSAPSRVIVSSWLALVLALASVGLSPPVAAAAGPPDPTGAPAAASYAQDPPPEPASEPTGEMGTQAVPLVVWAVGMAVVRAGTSKAVQRSVVVKARGEAAARTAARRTMTNGGGNVRSVGSASKATMRSHTAKNLRHNLAVRTDGTRVTSHAHHKLPQKFRQQFERQGIRDIDNPLYALWWCAVSHQRNAAAYNQDWEQFFSHVRANPRLGGRANTLAQMDKISSAWSSHYRCPPGTRTPV